MLTRKGAPRTPLVAPAPPATLDRPQLSSHDVFFGVDVKKASPSNIGVALVPHTSTTYGTRTRSQPIPPHLGTRTCTRSPEDGVPGPRHSISIILQSRVQPVRPRLRSACSVNPLRFVYSSRDSASSLLRSPVEPASLAELRLIRTSSSPTVCPAATPETLPRVSPYTYLSSL